MSGCNCDPNRHHGTACPIIAEFRQLNTAEGREAAREAYRQQVSRASGMKNDVPRQLQKLGLPLDAILAVKAPTQTKALAAAKRFINSPRDMARTLVLVGLRGVGKSVGAAWVLGDFCARYDWNGQPSGGKQFPPAIWAHAAEVTAVTDFGRVDPEWVENLKRTHVLVLDDLGHDGTEVGLAALRDVLMARHEKHRPTVITSNMSLDGLKARYGDSWFERLKVAALVPDLSDEKSLRKKKPSERKET